MRLAIICAMEEELAAIEAAVSLTLIAKLNKASNCYAEYQFGEPQDSKFANVNNGSL